MKVAVVGGTGSFGKALAARAQGRRARGGGRLARPGARAREAAEELGVEGAANADAVRDVDLVVLAVKADGMLDDRRGARRRDRRDAGPLRRRGARVHAGRRAADGRGDRRSRSGSPSASAAPVAAGLHSLAAANLAAEPPDEDALVCGDDGAKELALELAARRRLGPRARRGPARERARARGHDRGDREREPQLPGARGDPPHRHDVTRDRDPPGRGDPGGARGRRPRRAGRGARSRLEDGDVVVVAQKVVSKAEGRVVRLDELEPSAEARGARRRRGRSAPARGDPAGVGAARPRARRPRHRRDPPRLRLRLGRRRRVERAARPARSSCSRSTPTRRRGRSARACAS